MKLSDFKNNITPSSINMPNPVNIPASNSGDVNDGVYSAVAENIARQNALHEQKYHPILQDTKKLEDRGIYLSHANDVGEQDINKALAESQNALEQFGNALVQGIVGVAAIGAAEGFGDLYDIFTGAIFKSQIDDITGKPNEYMYRNKFTQWLLEKRNELNETFPIYSDKEYNMASGGLAHWSWYMQNMPSLFSFISFAVPSSATTAVLSKGVSLANRAAKAAKVATIGNKTAKAAKAAGLSRVGNAATAVAKSAEAGDVAALGSAGAAITRGSAEAAKEYLKVGVNGALGTIMANQMFAREVAYQQEQELTELFKDDEIFKKVIAADERLAPYANDKEGAIRVLANRAAVRDWEWNIITGIPITSQLYAMRGFWKGNPARATTNAIRREARYTAANIGKTNEEIQQIIAGRTFKQKAKDLVKDLDFSFGSNYRGYFDAGWGNAVNVIAENEGKFRNEHLLGKDNRDFNLRFKGYVADGHLWDAAVWGVLGGMFSNVVGSGVGRINERFIQKQELSEEKARIAQIHSINDTYQHYKSLMERINNGENIFKYQLDSTGKPIKIDGKVQYEEFENDTEKELAKEKLFRQVIADMTIAARNIGNADIVRQFILNENVQKAFSDAGYVSAEDAKQVSADAVRIMDRIDKIYNANVSAIDKIGIDPYVNRIISTENTRAQIALEDYNSAINSFEERIGIEAERLYNIVPDLSQEAFRVARYADQLRSLYDEKKRLESLRKSRTRDAAIVRTERAIEVTEKEIAKSNLTENQKAYIEINSLQTHVYENGKIKINPDTNIAEIDTRDSDERRENLFGDLSETERNAINNDFLEIARKSRRYFNNASTFLGSNELTTLINRKISYEMQRAIVQSQLNITDKNILERAAEVRAEIEWEAGKYRDNSVKILNEMMETYDPQQVYNYVNEGVDGAEDAEINWKKFTEEDKQKLDDAIDVLELDEFGHGALVDKVAELRDFHLGIKEMKKLEELSKQVESTVPKNDEAPVRDNPARTQAPPTSPVPVAPSQSPTNNPIAPVKESVVDEFKKDVASNPSIIDSSSDAILTIEDENGRPIKITNLIFNNDTGIIIGEPIDDEGNTDYNNIKQINIDDVKDVENYIPAKDRNEEVYSLVSESLFQDKNVISNNTTIFDNTIKNLLSKYKQARNLKGQTFGDAGTLVDVSFADFVKFLYDSGVNINTINKLLNELKGYIANNNEEVIYDGIHYYFDVESNNGSIMELYNYVKGNVIQGSKMLAEFQKLTVNTMSWYFLNQDTDGASKRVAGQEISEYIQKNVKLGDKLKFRYDTEKNSIVFTHNKKDIGYLPVPNEINGGWSQINDGWITDIREVNGKLESEFIDSLEKILRGTDENSKALKDLLYHWMYKYKAKDRIKDNDGIIVKFAEWLAKEDNSYFLNHADTTGGLTDELLRQLFHGIAKLYKYGSVTDWKLDLWKQKLWASFNLMHELYLDPNRKHKIVVTSVIDGVLRTTDEKMKGPIQERIVGLKEKPKDFKLGVTIEGGYISVAGETVAERFATDKNVSGRTYILFPSRNGQTRTYANVYPGDVSIKSKKQGNYLGKNAVAIVSAIQDHLYDLLVRNATERSDEAYAELRDFLSNVFNHFEKTEFDRQRYSLFGLRRELKGTNGAVTFNEDVSNNKASLAVSAGQTTINVEGETTEVAAGLYVPKMATNASNESFRAQAIIIDGVEISLTDVLDNEKTRKKLKKAIEGLFERMSFDIPYQFVTDDGVITNKQYSSIISRKDGKFVVSIPSTGEQEQTFTFDSFSDFILKENVGTTTVDIDPVTKTNFYYDEDNFAAQPRIEFKIIEPTRRKNTLRDNIVDFLKTSSHESDGDSVVASILNTDIGNLEKPEHFEIYPKHIIYKKSIKSKSGEEANASTKNGVVTITDKFMQLLDTKDKSYMQRVLDRNRAVRLLIHERLHQLLAESANKDYINKISDVYNEFKEALTDGRADDFYAAIASTNNTTVENVKTIYETYLFEDKDHVDLNSKLEEFLIESFTNKELSTFLNNVKAKDVGTAATKESLWQKLMNWVRKLLGIEKVNEWSLYQKEFNALADAMVVEAEATETEESLSSEGVVEDKAKTDTLADEGVTETGETEFDNLGNFENSDALDELNSLDEDDNYSTVSETIVTTDLYDKNPNVIPNLETLIETSDIGLRADFMSEVEDGLFNIKCK